MSWYQIVAAEDPCMTGNWYPFSPPEPGFYDLRQVRQEQNAAKVLQYAYYPNRRVYEGVSGRLLCMGKRLTRFRVEDGWQFRFHTKGVNGVPSNWRPFAVIYAPLSGTMPPQIIEKQDVSQQLPLARSREEALYIVRHIPERWPVFRKIHVEFTQEFVQG